MAALGKLDGVGDQIREHLPKPERIAHEGERHIGIDAADELQSFLRRAMANERGNLVNHISEGELQDIQLEFSCFDFREVQHVIHNTKQIRSSCVNLAQVVAVARGHLTAHGEVRQADDGIHRGPNLMADVGHELRLRSCRFGGLARGFRQRRVVGLQLLEQLVAGARAENRAQILEGNFRQATAARLFD